ncbi:MAG: hypothetical protein ABMA02_18350 [Saprospiraceae bacterium]
MKNNILQNGLLGGMTVIFYFTLLYTVGKETFLNPGLQWAAMIFYIAFMYRAAKADCADNGTDRDFRAILRTPFAVFVLVNLCYWLFFYGLHLYDLDLVRMELVAEKQAYQAMLDGGAGDPEQANRIREGLLEIDKAIENPVQPLGPVITRMAIGTIGGFGLSAGVAAVVRSAR